MALGLGCGQSSDDHLTAAAGVAAPSSGLVHISCQPYTQGSANPGFYPSSPRFLHARTTAGTSGTF